jgi:energy-coupling factor transporter ATP-binding protein EcfA2
LTPQEFFVPREPITKFDDSTYLSAYCLASGFLHYFSQTKEELRTEIEKLNKESDGNRIFQDLLSFFLSLDSFSDLRPKLDSLWEALQCENLECKKVLSIKEKILWSISQLSEASHLSGIYKELSIAFHELIQCIQPLNTELMMSYIQSFEHAAEMIAGKDIVLMLGETGAGKSTTIHFLAGSEMKEDFVDGFDHIHPTRAAPNVSQIKVGCSTQSVTKHLTAVEFPNGVFLCDTPGFGDTAGPEADIANGLGIIRSLTLANSVKPVMVLSQLRMDRFNGVREMNRIMKLMFVDVPSILPSVTYFFTKYDAKYIDKICLQAQAFRKECTTEDRFDLDSLAIVDDLITKTTPTALVIDPLMDSKKSIPPEEILSHLENVAACTLPPNEIFQTFVTPESANKLTEQWGVLQRQVYTALQSHNLLFLSKSFSEMQILNKLHLEVYDSYYVDSKKQLESYAADQLSTGKEALSACLFSRNNCTDQDLHRALEYFGRILIIDSLLVDLASEFDFSSQVKCVILEFLEKLSFQDIFSEVSVLQLNLLRQVNYVLQQYFYFVDESDCLQPHPVFQRSSIPVSFLDETCSYYFKCLSILSEAASSLLLEAQQMIDHTSNPTHLIDILLQFEFLAKVIPHHFSDSQIEEIKNQLYQYLSSRLQCEVVQLSSNLFLQNAQDYTDLVKAVSNFSSFLFSLKNSRLNDLLSDYNIRLCAIEDEFMIQCSQVIEKIYDNCVVSVSEDFLDLEKIEYAGKFLSFLGENVPLLAEITQRTIEKLVEHLRLHLSDHVGLLNRGLTKLATGETLLDSLELNRLAELLSYVCLAENTNDEILCGEGGE